MIPPGLLRWFWLLSVGIVALNVVVWHVRAGTLVRAGSISETERRRFSWGAAAALGGFCLLMQLIVWRTAESRIECLAAFPPATPASLATTALTLAASAALLAWVWVGNGAERLARFGPILTFARSTGRGYTAAGVRRFVTALVLVSAVGGAVAGLVVPAPPDCGTRGLAERTLEKHAPV
jgi:hypothetical protein